MSTARRRVGPVEVQLDWLSVSVTIGELAFDEASALRLHDTTCLTSMGRLSRSLKTDEADRVERDSQSAVLRPAPAE